MHAVLYIANAGLTTCCESKNNLTKLSVPKDGRGSSPLSIHFFQ